MAKELPYFQFEPAEHLAGEIQVCSLAAQGLFANIKSIYWIKGCKMTLKQLKGRFGEESLINELLLENILKVSGESVIIEFLDIQYKNIISKKRALSRAGKKGYLAKVNQARLKGGLSEVEAPLKQLDKIREDNIKDIYIPKSQATLGQNGKKISMVEKYDAFLGMFNEIGNRQFRGDSSSRKSFAARIKDGYGYKDMKLAVTNLYKDPKHRDEAFKYATPEFILRPSILERYINQKL